MLNTADTPLLPRRVVVVPGYGATPADHWFPRLAHDLAGHGIDTEVVEMPHPDAPDPTAWATTAGEAIGDPDGATVVVGHSLGCLTVLRYLATVPGPWRLAGLVLVAGFLDRLPALPELDGFVGDGADVGHIPGHVEQVVVIRSDHDPLVPGTSTDRLAAALDAELVVVPGAGHFLADDGYEDLPEVRDVVLAATARFDRAALA
jgi:predicted alpha/beta hydrolase family esterase